MDESSLQISEDIDKAVRDRRQAPVQNRTEQIKKVLVGQIQEDVVQNRTKEQIKDEAFPQLVNAVQLTPQEKHHARSPASGGR